MSTDPPSRPRRRAGLRLGAATLLLTGALGLMCAATGTAVADPFVAAAPSAEADAALDWLTAQLDANGATLPGFAPGTSDWGLTADAVLALRAGGRGATPTAQLATDQLATHLAEYTTWDPDVAGVRVAGASAKVLLVLASQGRDTSDVGGLDLETELRSLMVTAGPDAGRFADRVPDPTWDASNGFGQALSVLALAWSDAGVPTSAVEFLLAQQCPAGGFRLTYGTTGGCSDDAAADTDSTALAVQALLAVERTPVRDAALGDAVAWLLSRQDPSGAFGGTGPTSGLNANSTGVIAQALRAAGQGGAADAGAQWVVASTQLRAADVAGTPAAGAAGAIGYDPAARAAALTQGLTIGTVDQWRRATSQAVLGLGLAPYAPVVDGPVVVPTTTTPPPTTTVPTTTVPAPTTTAGAPVTVAPDAVAPDAVAPAAGVAGTTGTNTAGTSAGTRTATNPAAAGATRSVAAGSLAATGSTPAPLLWLGLVALFVGAVATGTARRLEER